MFMSDLWAYAMIIRPNDNHLVLIKLYSTVVPRVDLHYHYVLKTPTSIKSKPRWSRGSVPSSHARG